MKNIQIIVTGRVQGVCFRAETQKQAKKIGISGFVNNRQDGSVEIIACSEQDKLDQLVKWCQKGPIMAKVANVIINEFITEEKFSVFNIR